MSKRILIDTTKTDEIRVAVTADEILDDYEIESGKKNAVKGDVYLAKITRVEPSLQAAFVDFGVGRNGFLPLSEIHPDYFKIPIADQENLKKITDRFNDDNNRLNEKDTIQEIENDIEKKKIDDLDEVSKKEKIQTKTKIQLKDPKKEYVNFFRKYKIQDVIKPRQVILVQVNKEERGFKGAALTTFLSFAGRYCVLMPNSLNNDGISRKIGDIEERKKLKAILSSVNVPDNMSVIVRTAGIGKTKKEISKDLTYLTSQWNKIRENTLKSEAPNLIYEEGSIIKRTIRDLLTEDIEEVLVEGKDGFEVTKKLIKNIVPTKLKNIKLFKEKNKSLFSEKNIETQINQLFSLNVKLESGGSIVINTTEALVAIDVNSGKNTSERNIESTALKTNLEAAVEVARQLRLRDLGGLVVIDFIDMEDYRNNFKVEKAIKTSLYRDRARVQVGRISMFGLLELSRQRLRSSLIERSFEKCPYCDGSGLILNTKSISEQIINVIKEKIITSKGLKIQVTCNSALAETLINDKRDEIHSLEDQYECKINFNFDQHYSLHEPSIVSENEKLIKIQDKKSSKEKIKVKGKGKIKVKENIKVNNKVKEKEKEINEEKDLKKPKKKVATKKTKKKRQIKIKPRKNNKISVIKKDVKEEVVKKVTQKKEGEIEKKSSTSVSTSKVNEKTGWWSDK